MFYKCVIKKNKQINRKQNRKQNQFDSSGPICWVKYFLFHIAGVIENVPCLELVVMMMVMAMIRGWWKWKWVCVYQNRGLKQHLSAALGAIWPGSAQRHSVRRWWATFVFGGKGVSMKVYGWTKKINQWTLFEFNNKLINWPLMKSSLILCEFLALVSMKKAPTLSAYCLASKDEN